MKIINNNKDNRYRDGVVINENDNLKKMNEAYKLIISSLIEYINELSIYFIGKNTLELNYINNLLKTHNFKIDYTAINNLKAKLKSMKNNIINMSNFNKSLTMPLTSDINSLFEQEKKPIIKETNLGKYSYKPIIFERNKEREKEKEKEKEEKLTKSVDRSKVKKSKTWFERLPDTYWSLNKKIKLRENKKYK